MLYDGTVRPPGEFAVRLACLAALLSAGVLAADEPMRITTDGSFKEHLHWSPDGSRFVMTRHYEGKRALWTMAADGSDLKRLVAKDTPNFDGHWSPDSKAHRLRARHPPGDRRQAADRQRQRGRDGRKDHHPAQGFRGVAPVVAGRVADPLGEYTRWEPGAVLLQGRRLGHQAADQRGDRRPASRVVSGRQEDRVLERGPGGRRFTL